MMLRLDHASPVPLYHQIAEAIRYRIATGSLSAGSRLPALRDAASLWGANLHTVRRAYHELALAGVVATHPARGTTVVSAPGTERGGRARRGDLDGFLDRVLRDARARHGLAPSELIAALERRRAPSLRAPEATVYVAECSDTQSADLAEQLAARWRIRGVPWRVDREAPPEGHPIVATYFHFNDVRLRWTDRLPQVHFMAIGPDPGIQDRLVAAVPGARRATVLLCERDEPMLHNILADLSRLLPADRFRIRPEIVRDPEGWLRSRRSPLPVLFSPRLWGELSPEARSRPGVHEARFVFEPKDLDSIGATLRWIPRSASAGGVRSDS
ncbi:MAG TPA: GntR family transcriptional regulator [Candidatus Eisenbacteria bacterium]